MSGYIGFEMTGVPEIDSILKTLEHCGDQYHNTDQWADDDYGPSCLDQLQEAARKSASEITRLRAALREGIYEATHLSPENEDGSHWTKMSRAWLEQARAALEASNG